MKVQEKRNHLKEVSLEKEQQYNTLQKKLIDSAKSSINTNLKKEVELAYEEWQAALNEFNEFAAMTNEKGWTEDTEIPTIA